MDNNLKYPKNPNQIEICQGFIDIARRFMLPESTIEKIKEDIRFEEVPTYPDGKGNPIADMEELGKITRVTNIK